MNTFGYTGVGARLTSSGAGAGFVSTRLDIPLGHPITKLSFYSTTSGGPTVNARGAIYSVSSTDATNPDRLLALTDIIQITSETKWYDLPFPSPAVLSVSRCFLHVTFDGIARWFVDDGIAGWIGCWGIVYTVADPYPAHNNDVDVRLSLYGTYLAVPDVQEGSGGDSTSSGVVLDSFGARVRTIRHVSPLGPLLIG